MELMKTKKTPKSVSQTMVQACDIFNVFQIIKKKKKKKTKMHPLLKKSLVQRFSTGGDFCTQGTLGNVWRHFCLSQGPLVKSNGREARKPSILHGQGQPPQQRILQSPNVISADFNLGLRNPKLK